MPPTTTDLDLGELQRTHDTIHAVSKLFAAVAEHHSAVSLVTEAAVASADTEAIRDLQRILGVMSETLRKRRPPMSPRRTVES